MERIGNKGLGAGKVGVAPHVHYDRRRFGAKPCAKVMRGNGMFSIVHAQSPRQVECCAVLGPESQGETAFSPSGFLIWRDRKRNRSDYAQPAIQAQFRSARRPSPAR